MVDQEFAHVYGSARFSVDPARVARLTHWLACPAAFSKICGHTEVRIGVCKAKTYRESFFEVHFDIAPEKQTVC